MAQNQIINFAQAQTISQNLYIDTSFIWDLYRYPHDRTRPRLRASFDFYNRIVQDNIYFWTSYLWKE